MNLFKTLAATAALTFTGAVAPAADGKTYVLTVSVSQSSRLPNFRPLDQADASAKRLHAALLLSAPPERREGYRLGLDRDPGAHPTLENVRTVLGQFDRDVKTDDRVVVVLVGHGFENRDGAAFITCDSALADPKSFLAVREVVGRVKGMRCKQKCVFVDACRDYRDDLRVEVPAAYANADANDPDELERKKYGVQKEQSVFLVQSCSSGQYAYERPKGAGLMTERLVEAFTVPGAADANADGTVTVTEAVEYARKHVKQDARVSHRATQHLDDQSSGEPFLLAKLDKPAPGTKPTVLSAEQQPLPYDSQTIAFGPQPTFYPTSSGYGGYQPSDRPLLNAAVNGIPYDSRLGVGLDFARPFVPGQAQQYLPQTGVPLASQIRNWIR